MDNFFEITKRGSTVRTEIIGGLTTFFAMAYIIFVNPNQVTGFTEGLGQIWNSVYIGSILIAFLGTLMMALYAKMPLAQACGMGLNSFFFVSFLLPAVISEGDTLAAYKAGLVVVFVSGLVFLGLSVTGARQYIAKAMPECLKKSISAGIGLFIAFIGFQNVGIIQDNQYTLTQFVDIHGALHGEEGLISILPQMLALAGFLLIVALQQLKVKGNVLIGIVTVTAFYYILSGTTPSLDMTQVGQAFTDFGKVGLGAVFSSDAWSTAFSKEFVGGFLSIISYIIAFVMVDMFDTIGTLYGAASQAGMLDKNGDPVNLNKCMTCDSVATVAGACLGTSTCTTFVESASGIAAGARTGLASLVTAVCFFLCLFLTPLAGVVPACATAPALIYVGVLMLSNFKDVDMSEVRFQASAFLTLIMMPLTYSIANGIGIGAIAYTVITVLTGKFEKKDIMVTVIAILFLGKFCLITM